MKVDKFLTKLKTYTLGCIDGIPVVLFDSFGGKWRKLALSYITKCKVFQSTIIFGRAFPHNYR